MPHELRDLIYFDFDKAASLFSQIEGGLLSETQETSEGAKERRRLAKFDLKIFKPELGGISHEKTSVLESKMLHHDLLTRLEDTLREMELLLDVNQAIADDDSDFSDTRLRSLVRKPSFIIAEGWTVFEDYNRFSFIASNFKSLVAFIQKCAVQAIKDSPEYRGVQENIAVQKELIKKEKNGNRKRQMSQEIKKLEREIEEQVASSTSIEDLPDWLLEGIDSFIKTFMPNRINFRVYPFEQNADFHVLSNLKRDCFVDSDLENVVFAYGSRPNVPLSVLGMVTSLPEPGGTTFDPMLGLQNEDSAQDERQFESAFRQVFRAFEGFEGFVRFSRYPNVTVYPIAVYQRLEKVAQDDTATTNVLVAAE